VAKNNIIDASELDGYESPVTEIDASELDTEQPKSGTIRRALGDTGVSLLKGAIGVPETVVGLADLVTGGHAGKLAESAGFKPKQAKEFISDYYSPEQKLANQKVQEADGFVNTIKTALQNPSTIAQTTAESLPVMGLGGVGARGLLTVAPKLAPVIAGAAGEGIVTAGQNAEQLRQETADGLLTGKQAAIQAGSGLLTGVISAASGSIAQKLGIADIDTMLAQGKLNPAQLATGLPKAIAGGVISEGLLEEAPQSAQEQIAQNLSLDKTWDEGVGNAAAMGALSGGLMGGGANALNAFGGKDNTQVTPPPAPPAPEGSLTSAATIAQAVGLTPQPVMPDATEAKPNIVDSLNAVEAQQNGVMPDTAIAPIEPATIAPEQAAEKQIIDEQAQQAATSPLNDLPQPTEAQTAAGNYKKGHIKYDGLNITVENPQGSTRSGVDEDGAAWENTLANHYGYIKRTKGNDGDNLDVFVGDKPANGKVFVINQTKKDGSFDEHKAVLGAETADEAIAIYKSNYADDWNGGKSVTELTTPAFKDWLKNGDPTKPLETVSATSNDVDMTKVAVGEQVDVGGVPYVKTENGFERVTNATNVDTTTTLPERVDETANGVQVRKGEVGGMLAAQEVVTTASGRTTTPFPKFNGKDGKVSNFGLKAVDKWLVDNAIAEAESRNDDFNLTQFKAINLKNLSQADKDGAEEYLFGSQLPVVPSILKPLVAETAITPKNVNTETAAPLNESVQPADTVRPLVEQLTKLRATADKHPSFDPALKAAKDFMAGKKVSPKQFKNFANLLGKKNKAFSEVLMQLHDQAANTPEQLAAKDKKSKLAKAMLEERMKLDTTKDGLMQAMAKLGGLNADKAKAEFGIDPADMRQHGAGIKRSFTKTGLDADTMRELLKEQGYPVGESVADLGNAIADAMSGMDVLTAEGQEALAQKKYEEYANAISELSDDEQALLDELVTKATAKYGAEALAEIDASLAESMKGQPQVEIERALLRMLKEEFDDETGNAGNSQATEGQAGQDTETGSTENGSGRAQQDGANTESQGSNTSQVAEVPQEQTELDKFKASYSAKSDEEKSDFREMLQDAIVSAKENRNPYQQYVDRLAIAKQIDEGVPVDATAIFSNAVEGHAENNNYPLLRNLIPISVRSLAEIERKINFANDLYADASGKLSKAEYAFKIAKTPKEKREAKVNINKLESEFINREAVDALRNETLPELNRLYKLAEERFNTATQSPTDLLGDNTAAKQALVDAERAKDAKRNTGTDNQDTFTLSGSDSEFEQARAAGAQDLIEASQAETSATSQVEEKQEAYKLTFDQWLENRFNSNEYSSAYLNKANGDKRQAMINSATGDPDGSTEAMALSVYNKEVMNTPRDKKIPLSVYDQLSKEVQADLLKYNFGLENDLNERNAKAATDLGREREAQAKPYQEALNAVNDELKKQQGKPVNETFNNLLKRQGALQNALVEIQQGKEPDKRLIKQSQTKQPYEQTLPEYLATAKTQMSADEFESVKGSLEDEHYAAIEAHAKSGGKVSEGVLKSLAQGKQNHFAKTYAEDANRKAKSEQPKPETKADTVALKDTSDVGIEMLGNRRNKGLTLKDIQDANNDTERVAMAVKTKLWERPDYQALVDSGVQPAIAHIVKQIYDGLSSKPAYKGEKMLYDYVDVVEATKKAVDEFLSDKQAMARMITAVAVKAKKQSWMLNSNEVIDIANIGNENDTDIENYLNYFVDRVFPKNESGARWGRQNKEGNDKANATGNRFYKNIQLNLSSFIDAMKAVQQGFPAKQEAWQRSYQIKEADGKFQVIKKGRYSPKSEHATHDEAVEAARALVKREREAAFKEPETPVEKSVRKGRELRADGNVSSKELQDAVGLKAVNFGDWMKQPSNAKERQSHVNSAFDAFHDLAEVLNMPVKAMSLDGMLGLAIGAQGKGKFAAHFYPGYNEINLTREKGAGSLAHEWAHGLDHFFGVQAGLAASDEPFASWIGKHRNVSESGIRKEIVDAFHTIVTSMREIQETPETAKARITAQAQYSKERIEQYVERNGLKEALKDDETALAALDAIISGETGDYAEWPALKGKRKPQGYTSEYVKYIANKLGWNFDRANDLNLTLAGHSAAQEALKADPVLRKIHTEYYRAASILDGGKKDPYWSTPHELFARAFEMYVAEKLANADGRNDYLVSAWKQAEEINTGNAMIDDVLNEAKKRYPQGKEREAINAAFDVLFNEIKTKETDKGIALFASRGNNTDFTAITLDTANTVVSRVLAANKKIWNIDIIAVPTFDALPDDVKNTTTKQYGKDEAKYASGITHNGKVYVIADMNGSEQEAESIILHEVEGHIGIRRLYGTEINKKLNALYLSIGGLKGIKDIAQQRGITQELSNVARQLEKSSFSDDTRIAVMMEEMLAYTAQNPKFSDKAKAIIGMIRAWLREHGFMKLAEYGETDLLNVLREGRSKLNAKVDADGNVIAVMHAAFHGSPHDHDKFEMSKIGTGEGNQSYGYGLYFAGSQKVAEWYKNNLSRGLMIDGKPIDARMLDEYRDNPSGKLAFRLLLSNSNDGSKSAYSDTIEQLEKNISNAKNQSEIELNKDALKIVKGLKSRVSSNNGKLYEVELAPTEDEYLLWDKPLSEQSNTVIAALEKKFSLASFNQDFATAGEFYNSRARKFDSQEKASAELNSLGIRGIKYLDGSSRNKNGRSKYTGDSAYLYAAQDFKENGSNEAEAFNGLKQAYKNAIESDLQDAVNEAYDIQPKQDFNYVIFNEEDIGITAKYSRPQSKFSQKSTGIDIRDLNAVVANVNQALRGLPLTHVLEDYTKAPDELVADIKRDKAYDAAGAWHNGEIYLFRNNIINTNHALFTMLHESTHEGLRRVFGKEIDATLMGIYLSNKDIKQQADALRATHKDLSLVGSVEESLADMGGNGIKASVMDKLVAFLRNFLRRLGMNLTVSDGEVRTLVTRALDSLKSPSKVTHYTIGSAYSAASSGDQTNTPEFKAWFGDSKVVDADGKPLVVYHGTGNSFDTFDTSINGMLGKGAYFTTVFEEAAQFASEKTGIELSGENDYGGDWVGTYIKEVYLNVTDKNDMADSKWGDGKIYVARKPEQIKSATDNNGDFNPKNPDTRYSRPTPRLSPVVQPATPIQQWQTPDKSKLDNVIYMLQNKFVDLKRVIQGIQKAGNSIDDKWNPYLQEELYTGRTATRTKDFIKHELEPLMKSMQARKVDMADFEEYLWARHAEERNIQIAKINPAMQDGGSGMTTQDARDYLANLTPVQSANYQALAAKVDAILKTSRQRLISYGLETPETIAVWEGAYQHYVPLMREDMDNGFGNGSGQGFSVKGNASKRATGSKRAVVDVLANIAQQVERNIIRGEKNRVSTALVGLATLNPNKDFWKVDVVPTMRTVVAGKNTYEVLYNGSVVQTFTNPVEANKFIQWNGAGYTLNIVKGQDLVMDVPDPSYKNRDNVVVARIVNAKGKIEEHFVEFNTHDERAMRAAASIKNLDQDQIGELLGTAASITRYFSSINTQYNPFFGVINILRDVQGSLLNLSSTPLAGKQLDVLKNTPLALKGIYQDIRSERKTGTPTNSYWSLLFEDFQKQGGQTGYRDMFRNAKERGEALKHALDPTWWQQTTAGKIVSINGILAKPEQFLIEAGQKYIFDWLSDYNESMENAVRLSAYKIGLDNGMTKAQAASLAKNISVNFNRKGEMGRQIGSLYAFFNASVQGTARIGETLFTDNNGKLTLSKAGKAIVTGGLLLGVMQALMLAAAGFGDDEPPEFVRDRNLIIPLGNGKAITIAMPLGFNALPAFGRILTEWALSGGEDTSKRFFHIFEMLAEVTNPIGNAGLSMQTITPTMFDPLAALAENEDWTGRPIAKMDFNSQKPTAGHTRAKDTASAISKGLSWVVNEATGGSDYTPGAISPTPDQIDYLLGQIFGGVGREYMKLEQSATSIVTGEELPVYKIPLVGRFYLNAEGQSSQSSRFYDNLKSVFETETELKGLRKDGLDTSEYRANHPEAALVFRANLEQREISQLHKLRSEKLKADASPEEIKALNERITARMLRFNELFIARTTAGE